MTLVVWKCVCADCDMQDTDRKQTKIKNNFSEICIMKFSCHEISLFILKVQRILNKSRLGTSESELETSLCHCVAPLGGWCQVIRKCLTNTDRRGSALL